MTDAEFLREVVVEIVRREGRMLPQIWIDRVLDIADSIDPDNQPFRPLDPEDKPDA